MNSVTRFGKISHFCKNEKVWGNTWKDYLVFGEILNLLWQTSCTIGHILIVTNNQILKTILPVTTLKICPINKKYPKSGSKLCQLLNEPWKDCQIGEISPNLVRLNMSLCLNPTFAYRVQEPVSLTIFRTVQK